MESLVNFLRNMITIVTFVPKKKTIVPFVFQMGEILVSGLATSERNFLVGWTWAHILPTSCFFVHSDTLRRFLFISGIS
jgi:hypothetical protein